MSAAAIRLSLKMQALAGAIDAALEVAGKRSAFVLVLQVDGVAQYVSNADRSDGQALIESLLARWKAGRADIPAHYNPDLRDAMRDMGLGDSGIDEVGDK